MSFREDIVNWRWRYFFAPDGSIVEDVPGKIMLYEEF